MMEIRAFDKPFVNEKELIALVLRANSGAPTKPWILIISVGSSTSMNASIFFLPKTSEILSFKDRIG